MSSRASGRGKLIFKSVPGRPDEQISQPFNAGKVGIVRARRLSDGTIVVTPVRPKKSGLASLTISTTGQGGRPLGGGVAAATVGELKRLIQLIGAVIAEGVKAINPGQWKCEQTVVENWENGKVVSVTVKTECKRQ
jgi:hypothetical protein